MILAETSCQIANAGLDWLTLTARAGTDATSLYRAGEELLHAEERAGTDIRRTRPLGYDGWTGEHVLIGQRPDGVLVRLSSWIAAAAWARVVPLAHRCTRVDCQVTVDHEPPTPGLARRLYEHHEAAEWRGPRKPGATYFQNTAGGETCYIGSRSSDTFCRVYDKGVQASQAAQGSRYRWEVEYKGHRADDLASRLRRNPADADGVGGIVHREFERLRLVPPWEPGGDIALPDRPTHSSSDERTLAWLHEQVRPAVARLVRHGHADSVRFILGLPYPVPADERKYDTRGQGLSA